MTLGPEKWGWPVFREMIKIDMYICVCVRILCILDFFSHASFLFVHPVGQKVGNTVGYLADNVTILSPQAMSPKSYASWGSENQTTCCLSCCWKGKEMDDCLLEELGVFIFLLKRQSRSCRGPGAMFMSSLQSCRGASLAFLTRNLQALSAEGLWHQQTSISRICILFTLSLGSKHSCQNFSSTKCCNGDYFWEH
jgi:hypothetical protein